MKHRFTPLVAGTVLALFASACSSSGTSAAGCSTDDLAGSASGTAARLISVAAAKTHNLLAQAGGTVKVGFFGDLTGGNSALVTGSRNGAALAIEQRNTVGDLGVTVEFMPIDNKDASSDTAPSVEQKFIQDKGVVGVIGGAFSGETLAVGELFSEAGLAHVSPSATNPDITTHGWPFFRLLSTDVVQGAKAAALIDGLGCEAIAVINDKTDYGQGLADVVSAELAKLGTTVALTEGIEPTTDYTTLVASIEAAKPDLIFYGGYTKETSLIIKQLREAGVDALFMSGDGSKEQVIVDQAGAANAEGTILTCPCADPNVATDDASMKFVADYTAKYGAAPSIYAAEGYDAGLVMLEAIAASAEDGKVTRPEIVAFLEAADGLEGITKSYTWDDTGEIAGGVIIAYQVKDGKIVQLGSIDDLI